MKRTIAILLIVIAYFTAGMYMLLPNIHPMTWQELIPFFTASFGIGIFIGPVFIFILSFIIEAIDHDAD